MSKLEKDFMFSQNSLSIYKFCPVKFKYIYLDGVFENIDSSRLREGRDFHLLAERYFKDIDDNFFYINDSKLVKWGEILKESFPLQKNVRYLSEFEIKKDKKILGRYDLIILKENSIEIIDFKTNEKKYEKNRIEESLQTKIYMYLLGESIKKFGNYKIKNISMRYFQLNFPKDDLTIVYNEGLHEKNRKELENLINKALEDDFGYELYPMKKCKNCSFEKKCKKIKKSVDGN